MAEKRKNYKELEKKLIYKSKNIWENISNKEKKEIFELGDDYKNFISTCKTEREVVKYFVKKAEKEGFINIKKFNKKPKKGDKVYFNWKDKSLALVVFGEKDFEKGFNIIGAHADVPRLDLKQRPLFEDSELALLKTHYYGGIKNYHWVNIPLALHGVILTSKGEKIEIVIGENENDPVFVISDLLIHLSRKVQGEKKLLNGIESEKLVLIAGHIPVKDKDIKEKVKLAVLEHLYEKYGIIEEDFISAEIEIVPAIKARDIGFDRALIGAYGHDDRVCSYLAAESIFKVDNPEKGAIALIVDKEEIGSTGNTGSDSFMLYNLFVLISELYGNDDIKKISKSLMNSSSLSADVTAAVNPMYKDVHDLKNAAYLSHGIAITKFTGRGGKFGANDADAEMVYKVRSMFNREKIYWQYSALGKVDEGGGGTIAKYVSYFGIDTIDTGVPVMGMHSPMEIISKADLWAGLNAFKLFFSKYE